MMLPLQIVMMNRRNAALAVVALLLTVACLWRGQAAIDMPALPILPDSSLISIPQSAGFRSMPASTAGAFVEAAERPLFNPNRKRFIDPVPDTPVAVPSNRPFRLPVLLGIVGSGERRIALVKLPDERDSRRLRLGDTHDGWTVAEIGKDVVVFKSGSDQREIKLATAKDGVGGNMTAGMGRR